MEQNQVNTHESLLALVQAKKAEGGCKPVISDLTLDDYRQISNADVVFDYQIRATTPELYWRQEKAGQVPFVLTGLSYRKSVYKSDVSGHLGELELGLSCAVLGYDVERDGQGEPITKETEVNGETVTEYNLITKDDQGKPLEPRVAMVFKPQFGIAYSKQAYARRKDVDQLNLVPGQGVPLVDREISDGSEPETNQNPYRPIAWNLITGLETLIKKPILNAELEQNTDMLEWIKDIPTASNAPSKRGVAIQETSFGKTGNKIPDIQNDAFAGID